MSKYVQGDPLVIAQRSLPWVSRLGQSRVLIVDCGRRCGTQYSGSLRGMVALRAAENRAIRAEAISLHGVADAGALKLKGLSHSTCT